MVKSNVTCSLIIVYISAVTAYLIISESICYGLALWTFLTSSLFCTCDGIFVVYC